ncbi:hypothetical protein [Pseudoalteromonas shioyasakiensis]|uniref:hypothetical protein n=1 Tax=Pseudoalteromonas shioyasakiensis TaxID=1190813 RepID=UPI002551FF9A|nr:hypothetical protein [Pseudoalteromonas shioyasakiensis]MDK9683216.1 hypothetical protein [Pseudoalteromonas shioyasakiensis]
MKYLSVVLFSLIALGCSADESEFTQTDCDYLNEDYLIVSVSSNSARRALSIGNSALTFKGTTLKDMKWLAEFSDIQSVSFENEVALKITLKSGFSKSIGTVSSSCRVLINKHFEDRGIDW